MLREDFSKAIGKEVRDIYGRNLGRCIGFTVDLSGNLRTIGVELGTSFQEYPADRLLAGREEDGIVTIPDWKADSRRVGMEKGVLEKRINALTKMLEAGEISQKVYDDMYKGLMTIRASHEQLSRDLVRRLDALEENDDKINTFLARVKLQGVSEEISEQAVKWTADFCVAMKSMNESERVGINEILDLVSEESASTPAIASPSEGLATEELMEAHLTQAEPEQEEEIRSEEEEQRPAGSLRSLGSSDV